MSRQVQASKWKKSGSSLYHRCGPHYVFADCKHEQKRRGHRSRKVKDITFNGRLRALLKRMTLREIKDYNDERQWMESI